jgi:hypothetical protein
VEEQLKVSLKEHESLTPQLEMSEYQQKTTLQTSACPSQTGNVQKAMDTATNADIDIHLAPSSG